MNEHSFYSQIQVENEIEENQEEIVDEIQPDRAPSPTQPPDALSSNEDNDSSPTTLEYNNNDVLHSPPDQRLHDFSCAGEDEQQVNKKNNNSVMTSSQCLLQRNSEEEAKQLVEETQIAVHLAQIQETEKKIRIIWLSDYFFQRLHQKQF